MKQKREYIENHIPKKYNKVPQESKPHRNPNIKTQEKR